MMVTVSKSSLLGDLIALVSTDLGNVKKWAPKFVFTTLKAVLKIGR